MDKLVSTIFNALGTVASEMITVEAILILGCILFSTEFLKQSVKGGAGKRFLKIKYLSNYQIRGISALIGILFTYIFIDGLAPKLVFGYGIFYGGFSFVTYWFIKRFIIARFSPKLNNKMSGQVEE